MKSFMKFFSGVLLLFIATCAFTQSNESTKARVTRNVTIPFQFWIDSQQFPSGDYVIEQIAGPNELLFRSKDGKRQEEVFLVASVNQGADPSPKLIFVVHEGKNILTEVWGTNYKRVINTRYGMVPQKGDTTREVIIQNSVPPTKARVPAREESDSTAICEAPQDAATPFDLSSALEA